MKKILLFFLGIASPLGALYGDPPKSTLPPKSPEWLQDQQDQTDTLAIPLDSSEAEDNAELKRLEKGRPLPKKNQEK